MQYFSISLSFLLGVILGGVFIHLWRAGGVAGATRLSRVKLVIITAVITLLTAGATGYGYFRYRFRQRKLTPATTADALSDFRKSGGTAKAKRGLPLAGVYTYRTKGYSKVTSTLLGDSSQPLPPTIPAVLILKGNCWDLTTKYFKGNERTERYCITNTGVRLTETSQKSHMFGISSFTRIAADKNPLVGPTGIPGSKWEETWKILEIKSSMPFPSERPDPKYFMTYLGNETLTIGTQKVTAIHVLQKAPLTGIVKGTMERELWYSAENGLMVKMLFKSHGEGIASIDIDQQLELTSLTPKK